MRPRLLILLIAGICLTNQPAYAQMRGTFAPTGEMTTARYDHTATLLLDGKVLIAGGHGQNGALSSAEVYDPATGLFTPAGDMKVRRRLHSATLLADGKVLIIGGLGESTGSTSAEIFDPSSGTFSRTASTAIARYAHSATRLFDGRVLVGNGGGIAEVYDPATSSFSSTSLSSGAGGFWPTANVLPDGRVLFVGGGRPDIYDPATDSFQPADRLKGSGYRYEFYWHESTTLGNGNVLITGGNDDWTCGGFRSAEVYDVSANAFRLVSNMIAPREAHTGTLLRDGMVLLAGGGAGWCSGPTQESAELYDPAIEGFIRTGNMTRKRAFHTATLLNDGTVLIAGGLSYWPLEITRSAERYRSAERPARGRPRRR